MMAMDSLEVDQESFAAAYAAGAVVLDVRNPDEYEAAHVPEAILIPLPELRARLDEVPADEPLYVICASGVRSLRAAEALAQNGYSARSVAGGTIEWVERGGKVATGPA
jgi:rhodanese-related sulfurtransferase